VGNLILLMVKGMDNLNGDFNKGTAVLDYWTTQVKMLMPIFATRANNI
jgi:hypothetical protein